jgi:hypothetical protein
MHNTTWTVGVKCSCHEKMTLTYFNALHLAVHGAQTFAQGTKFKCEMNMHNLLSIRKCEKEKDVQCPPLTSL